MTFSPALTLRPARPEDGQAIVDVVARAEPFLPMMPTVADLEQIAGFIAPGAVDVRLVAEVDGGAGAPSAIVGHIWLRDEGFPRDTLLVKVRVDPRYGRQGIGSALLATALRAVKDDPRELATLVGEESQAGVAFALARGFRERYRIVGWRIDPRTFDPSRHPLKPLPTGIRLTTLAEVDSPELRDRLYALAQETFADIPMPDASPPANYEEYAHEVFEGPRFDPSSVILAMAGDRPIGECRLQIEGERAWNAFTAVARSHRGQGIAWQLKHASLALARDRGVTTLRTENHTTNPAMLSINERVGFERVSGLVRFALLPEDRHPV